MGTPFSHETKTVTRSFERKVTSMKCHMKLKQNCFPHLPLNTFHGSLSTLHWQKKEECCLWNDSYNPCEFYVTPFSRENSHNASRNNWGLKVAQRNLFEDVLITS